MFRLPGVRFRLPGLPGLAARTLFFDTFFNAALDEGVRQVVIVGAGYDSRAVSEANAGTQPIPGTFSRVFFAV